MPTEPPACHVSSLLVLRYVCVWVGGWVGGCVGVCGCVCVCVYICVCKFIYIYILHSRFDS